MNARYQAGFARASERTGTRPVGSVLRCVPYRAETARALEGLIEAERQCCPFLDFKVDRARGEIRVSLSFPAEVSVARGMAASG